jgi:hypothetical protein
MLLLATLLDHATAALLFALFGWEHLADDLRRLRDTLADAPCLPTTKLSPEKSSPAHDALAARPEDYTFAANLTGHEGNSIRLTSSESMADLGALQQLASERVEPKDERTSTPCGNFVKRMSLSTSDLADRSIQFATSRLP